MIPRKRRTRIFPVTTALAIILAWAGLGGGCVEGGGSSSETVGLVTGVSGREGIKGRTDAGNFVGLYSANYLPQSGSGFADTVHADANGAFSFAGMNNGYYHILVKRPADGKAAFLTEIYVPSGTDSTFRANLEPTAVLSGVITDSLASVEAVVYVPGSPFFARGDSLMRYSLPGLPAGYYEVSKTWRESIICNPNAACGGASNFEDSATLLIHSGGSEKW